MAYRPMSRPDSFDPPRPSDVPISLGGKAGSEVAEAPEEALSLSELATALSAHGGGVLSADLALDLVLNDIVEHARLATGATAAAIALARGDEIVCRATTGDNAPDLGVRLEVDAGLSGACVQSKKWQRCDDSETDSRVDAGICRSLGVRSILVFPVVREGNLLGVFEIFSPRPNAFSDREIQTLEALSRSIVSNVDRAGDVLAAPAPVVAPSPMATAIAIAAFEEEEEEEESGKPAVPELADSQLIDQRLTDTASFAVEPSPEIAPDSPAQPRDYWMTVLTMIVIALALFVGWMWGYVRRPRGPVGNKVKTVITAPAESASKPSEDTAASSSAVSAPNASTASNSSATQSSASQSSGATAVPAGGLVVYENGKVIYRTPSQSLHHSPQEATAPVTVPSKVADEYLVLRVEPEYPETAREQHIQGPVVLEALVGKDGGVEKLSTVSGDSQLAAAATDAVRQWRFKPFYRNGSPEDFQTQITVSFRLP
jgi:TonB family protein